MPASSNLFFSGESEGKIRKKVADWAPFFYQGALRPEIIGDLVSRGDFAKGGFLLEKAFEAEPSGVCS
jgi:hypothetical protein